MQNERPRKLQRISQACDLCHRRSIRCRPSNEDGERCQNCYDFDVACTYDRPSKRRKHPQAPSTPRDVNLATTSHVSASSSNEPSTSASAASAPAGRANLTPQGGLPDFVEALGTVSPANARTDLVNSTQGGKRPDHGALVVLRAGGTEELDLPWKAFALATEAIVLELLDIFMQIIYPIYPLFDGQTVRQRFQNKDHLADKGFFAAVMAACALTSARVRDGAYVGTVSEGLRQPETSSEIFFSAAKEALASDFGRMNSVEYIRACTLMSLTCIQYGQSVDVQQYLGKAFTLAAMHRFYDEKYWPTTLNETEKETYRRVYWCTYTLDVYSAIVWSCFLRSQEIHAYVRYPNDIDDHNVPKPLSSGPEASVSWLVGWNFSLDLYRVLEHVVNKARAKKFTHDDRRSVDSLVFADTFSDRDVMQTMLNMYYELPRQFKETPPMTGDIRNDIFGFQAANIQATLQLLRMILFSLEDGPGVERKCDVANEVLQVFHTIPIPYLRAISTPLVYQLGSIGHILGSVLEEPLTQAVYQRIRTALTLMADLLEDLESVLRRSAGAAKGLRAQIVKIDEYMRTHNRPPQSQMHTNVPQSDLRAADIPVSSMPIMPDAQLLPEMHADWPWKYFQEGNYLPGNMDGDQS